MIYILFGNDLKNRNLFKKTLTKGREVFFVKNSNFNKDLFLNYATANVLFGSLPAIVTENVLKQDQGFSEKELAVLNKSETIFIFQEDSLLKEDEKVLSKNATIKKFEDKVKKNFEKINVFSIAESFSNKNKIETWVLFRQAIDFGITPENICGVLFWKIKNMILFKNKFFHTQELKNFLNDLVNIHHSSHRGEMDFEVSLEQFILSSLSNK